MKLSGLQRQVLSLYRSFLRVARSKSPESRREMEAIVRAEFRKNAAGIERKDFTHIEYLLNKGSKQLEMLKNSSVSGVTVFQPKQFCDKC